MKLAVITLPTFEANEAEVIRQLLDEGAYRIHLRKPDATIDELRRYLDAVHPECLNRVVMHYHPLLVNEYGLAGFHYNSKNVSNLQNDNFQHKSYSAHVFDEALALQSCHLDYVFLSPIFESVSKIGYSPIFTLDEVRTFVRTAPSSLNFFALGGISADTIQKTKELGFDGAALLGAVWQNFAANGVVGNVVQQFRKIQQLCDLS